MSARSRLRKGLRAVARRMMTGRRVAIMSWWAALGIALGGATWGTERVVFLFAPWWLPLVVLGLALVPGLIICFRLRVSDREAARTTDTALGLRERLGTAVECTLAGEGGEVVDALMDEAADTCDTVDPRGVVPTVAPPARQFRLPALLALAAGAFLLTATFWPQSPEEQAARDEMKRQGQKLVEVAKEVRREAPERLKQDAKALAEALEALAQGFESGRVSKRDALEELGKLTDEVRSQEQTFRQDQAAQDLSKAAEQLQNTSFASEEANSIADALRNADMTAAQEKVRELAEKLARGELSQEQLDTLAKDLKKLAEAMGNSEQLHEAAKLLQQAAGACESGQCQSAAQLSQEAAKMLAEALEGAEALADAEALSEILAELEASQDQIAGAGEGEGEDLAALAAGAKSTGGFCSPQDVWSEEFDPNAPGGPGPGGGSTNQSQATGPEGQTGYEDEVPGDTTDEGEFAELYDPRETEHGSLNTRVTGQIDPTGEAASTETRTGPHAGEAFTPYYNVGEAARAAQEEAMQDATVPREYRDRVRSYFESLDE